MGRHEKSARLFSVTLESEKAIFLRRRRNKKVARHEMSGIKHVIQPRAEGAAEALCRAFSALILYSTYPRRCTSGYPLVAAHAAYRTAFQTRF